jgi:hypothetical protein
LPSYRFIEETDLSASKDFLITRSGNETVLTGRVESGHDPSPPSVGMTRFPRKGFYHALIELRWSVYDVEFDIARFESASDASEVTLLSRVGGSSESELMELSASIVAHRRKLRGLQAVVDELESLEEAAGQYEERQAVRSDVQEVREQVDSLQEVISTLEQRLRQIDSVGLVDVLGYREL